MGQCPSRSRHSTYLDPAASSRPVVLVSVGCLTKMQVSHGLTTDVQDHDRTWLLELNEGFGHERPLPRGFPAVDEPRTF